MKMIKYPGPDCAGKTIRIGHNARSKVRHRECQGCGKKWTHYYEADKWVPTRPARIYETKEEAAEAKRAQNREYEKRRVRVRAKKPHIEREQVAVVPVVVSKPPATQQAPSMLRTKSARHKIEDLLDLRSLIGHDPLFTT